MTQQWTWLLAALMITIGIVNGHAQSTLKPWVGIGGSYRSLAIGAERTNNAELAVTSSSPDQFFQPSLTAGVRLDLSTTLQLKSGLQLWYASIRGAGSRPVILSVDGTAVDASLETSYNVKVIGACIDMGFRWQIGESIGMNIMPGIAVVAPLGITMHDRIISNTQAVFSASDSIIQQVHTARVPTDLAIMGSLAAELDVMLLRTATTSYCAVLSTRALTSHIASNTSSVPWEFALGLQVSFNDGAPASVAPSQPPTSPPPVRRVVTVFDTVNIVDAWSDGRLDTFYVAGNILTIDSMLTIDADTVLIRKRQTIERHLPGPRPYLSTVLELDVKGLPVDSLVTMEIRGTVISEGRATTILRVHIDGVPVASTTHVGDRFTYEMRLIDFLKSTSFSTKANIIMTAETTDAFGQTIQASPVYVSVRRRANHKVDIDIP